MSPRAGLLFFMLLWLKRTCMSVFKSFPEMKNRRSKKEAKERARNKTNRRTQFRRDVIRFKYKTLNGLACGIINIFYHSSPLITVIESLELND